MAVGSGRSRAVISIDKALCGGEGSQQSLRLWSDKATCRKYDQS